MNAARQIIELPASDKNWRMKLSPNGERFIFSHPDFPTRIVGRDKSCSIVTVQPEQHRNA